MSAFLRRLCCRLNIAHHWWLHDNHTRSCTRCGRQEAYILVDMGMNKIWVKT